MDEQMLTSVDLNTDQPDILLQNSEDEDNGIEYLISL